MRGRYAGGMLRIAQNAGRALRLDRRLYERLLYDSAATADAMLIVLVAGVVPVLIGVALGRIGLVGIPLFAVRQGVTHLIGWLVGAGALHLIATKAFGSYGPWPSGLALSGYAYVPFVLVSVATPLVANPFDGVTTAVELLVRMVGVLWFAAGLNRVADVAYDLPPQRSTLAAGLAVVAWWIVTLIIL